MVDLSSFTRILTRFPYIHPLWDDDSVMRQYIRAHEEENEKIGKDIKDVMSSKQLMNATDKELDRLGKFYGVLGERSGRGDDEYRQYLQTIVNTFRGRGTVPGIKFAVGGAIGMSADIVWLTEHFNELENTLTFRDWNYHFSKNVVQVFDLARPSVVQLRYPLYYILTDTTLGVVGDAGPGNRRAGLGAGVIGDNHIGFYSGTSTPEDYDGVDPGMDGLPLNEYRQYQEDKMNGGPNPY